MFPVVCLFEAVVFVAEAVELDPDHHGDVLHHILSVELLPGGEADIVVAGDERGVKDGHHAGRGAELPHPLHPLLQQSYSQ